MINVTRNSQDNNNYETRSEFHSFLNTSAQWSQTSPLKRSTSLTSCLTPMITVITMQEYDLFIRPVDNFIIVPRTPACFMICSVSSRRRFRCRLKTFRRLRLGFNLRSLKPRPRMRLAVRSEKMNAALVHLVEMIVPHSSAKKMRRAENFALK